MIVKVCLALVFCLMPHVAHNSSASSRPLLMAKATKVAICEESGWNDAHGPRYFGALGWLDSTWLEFRSSTDPRFMDEATPLEQAEAMARFAHVYGWPDQFGCQGSY